MRALAWYEAFHWLYHYIGWYVLLIPAGIFIIWLKDQL